MSESSSTAEAPEGPKRWPLYLVLFAMVIIPYTFWRMTWFGEELSDEQIIEYMTTKDQPRKSQHALVQISQRMHTNPSSTKKFYSLVIELSHHDEFKIRSTAAWVMGQDNKAEAFHEALLAMLGDPAPLVRYNSALALANFGDTAALPVLRLMLEPLGVRSAHKGQVIDLLSREDPVVAETQIALITDVQGEEVKIVSPIEGKIQNVLISKHSQIAVGDLVCTIAPSFNQLWETLRALYLVGQKEDLDRVGAFAKPSNSYPEKIQVQARMTAETIRIKN